MNHGLIRVVFVLGMSTFLLAGCRATHSVKGKVVEGTLSFIALVSHSDERLKSPGLEGVTVEGRLAGAVFAQTTTDDQGNFSLDTKEQGILMKPVEFSASKTGYRPAAQNMNLPPNDRRLLIIIPKLGTVPVPP